jgi:hypothetical protein
MSGAVGPTSGYSGTPLPRKLGLKPGHVVFLDGAPAGFDLAGMLDPAEAAAIVWPRRLPAYADVTMTFHYRAESLAKRLPALVDRTARPATQSLSVAYGMLWVCWPKKAAHKQLQAEGVVVDLDENQVRDLGLTAGLVDVKVAAIDEVWSGLKFVRRLVDRV